ncbi:MAG: hypothetical protein R3E83_06155 [Burkholderiaceae bacterium]
MSSRIPCAIAVALAVVGAGAHADPLTPSPADEPRYESGFDGYRADTEIELRDWRATNDRVRTVGGWRTYLKEAAEARPEQPSHPPRPSAIGTRVAEPTNGGGK